MDTDLRLKRLERFKKEVYQEIWSLSRRVDDELAKIRAGLGKAGDPNLEQRLISTEREVWQLRLIEERFSTLRL